MKKEKFVSPRYYANDLISQVVKYGDIAYISGIVPINTKGEFVGGTIKVQSEAVLQSLKYVVEDMGLTLDNILMIRCYMSDMSKIGEFNEVYARYFQDVAIKPARCTVGADMGQYGIEIYAIAGLK